MKKLFICLNVLVLSMGAVVMAYGKAVDQNTAKTVGSNYLISNGINGVKSPSDLSVANIATATVNGNSIVDYYVFNINGNKGFVIVSGDDQVIPILAYSNEASFDVNHIAPDAKWWMNGYANQITYVIENGLPAKAGTAERWNSLKTGTVNSRATERTTTPFPSSTAHLIQTTWNQNAPSGNYNMYCPTGTPTGCVATCMAEIMQFWNWPTVGCGYNSYTPATTPSFGVQSADFGNTVYDWATMDASLTSSTPATALLMYHCGVAVNMDYTTSSSGSGAYVIQTDLPAINCAEYAMKTYFHYERSLKGYARSGFPPGIAAISDPTWVSMIETELNAGRPVMYTGQGHDGGHCWACDGWNTSGTGTGGAVFHFNFGWDGESNGFYSVDNVAPPALGTGGGSSGNNFNSDQSIVIGIMPDSFPSISGNIKLLAHLDYTTNSPAQYPAAPLSVTTKILNGGTTTFNGSFCAQVFDTLNHLIGMLNTMTETITAGDSTASLTFSSPNGFLNMIPETYYYIQVMYKASGSSSWALVANNSTFINYTMIDVQNSYYISNYQSLELGSPLTVTPGVSFHIGTPISVSTYVFNNGTATFGGTIQGVLINVATGTKYTIQQYTGQTINAGQQFSYIFAGPTTGIPGGTYVFAVQHIYGGTAGTAFYTGSDFYENPIIIDITGGVGVNSVSTLADKVSVYPNPANDIINMSMQGVDVSGIRITDIGGHEVMTLAPGNQSFLSVPVKGLAAGMYFVQFQTSTESIIKKIVIAK